MIFDTDVLIWRLRGHHGAIRLVEDVVPAERNVCVVSYLELLYGCRDVQELELLKKSLAEHFSDVIPATESICRSAARLMERYTLSREPGSNDVLIAATALDRDEMLATSNAKHFSFVPGLELRVFRPGAIV